MKRIAIVVVSTILLAAGCQKTEIVNPAPEPSMVFTTGMTKLTKASGTAGADKDGIVNLQAQDFRVWAYNDYEDPNTSEKELDNIYDHMSNMNVAYTAASSESGEGSVESWAPAKEYYWPGVNKSLRFFAVSGVNLGTDLSETEVVTVQMNRNTTGEGENSATSVAPVLTINDFVVDHEYPDADLMIADFVCQDQSKKDVNLKFRHALSKVQFLFKTLDGADRSVYVQSLSVTGIKTKSTLTVKENTNEETKTNQPMLFEWGERTEPQNFKDEYNDVPTDFPENVETMDESATVDTTAMKLTTTPAKFATWLVMPQDDISSLQVKVRYIIGTREFESIFALDTDALTEWKANQYIRYTVTLSPNLISFSPTVEDWDQYDANGDTTDDTDGTEDGKQDIEMQN